jgi:hypothetical protein
MSEHEHTEPQPDERDETVDDLDVPEEQQDDVAGGLARPDKWKPQKD